MTSLLGLPLVFIALSQGQELNPPIQQVGAIDNGYGYDYQHQQSWIPPNDYQYWPNSNGYQGPPPEIPLDVALAQQQQFGPWPPYPEGGGHVQEVPLEQAQWMVQQGQEPIMQDNLNLDWNQNGDWGYGPPGPQDQWSMGQYDQFQNLPLNGGGLDAPCGYVPESDPCDYDGAPFIPICDVKVCIANCKKHFGFSEGACFNNECYCRNIEPEDDGQWGYDNQDDWPNDYPMCEVCPMHQQSPIDLEDDRIRNLRGRFDYHHYDANVSFILENTGHGLRMLLQSNGPDLPSIQVLEDYFLGSVREDMSEREKEYKLLKKGIYSLAAIDFHWGSSEHSINGLLQNVEMQMYHYNMDLESLEDAFEEDGNVLAVGVMFKVDKEKSDLKDGLFDLLDEVISPNNIGVTVGPGQFLKFLTNSALGSDFGVYKGSTTQPPCFRSVAWLVSTDLLRIRVDQVQKLQTLQDEDGKHILRNSREQQPPNPV